MTNGLSHPYHLDESTIILRGIASIFFISFFDKIHVRKQNSSRLDAAFCVLGLFCLPSSNKRDRLKWDNRDERYRHYDQVYSDKWLYR